MVRVKELVDPNLAPRDAPGRIPAFVDDPDCLPDCALLGLRPGGEAVFVLGLVEKDAGKGFGHAIVDRLLMPTSAAALSMISPRVVSAVAQTVTFRRSRYDPRASGPPRPGRRTLARLGLQRPGRRRRQ
jgi:hypothetical protein